MVKAKEQEQILLKYALALSKLLELNVLEANAVKGQRSSKQKVTSLGQLSVDTELRPATLSSIFLGRSNLKAVTVVRILKSLGRSYSEFAEQFDKLTDKDISDFKNKMARLKVTRGRPSKHTR